MRDWNGLESAASRPRNYALYQDADLALQAAVLAHAIAEGQPFIDGNKRAAGNAMLYFLTLNGCDSSAPEEELALWLIELSAGLDVEALANRIRATLVPLSEA